MPPDPLNDLRRERIAAATDVFERVLRGYGEGAPQQNGHPPRAERVQLAQLRTAVARTADLYAQLMQEALEAVVHLGEDLAPSAGAAAEPPLELLGRAGVTVSTPLWIHNPTDRAVTGVALWLTDLHEPGGAAIAGAAGHVSPARLDIEPRASGEARLYLAVPVDAGPAVYHGHLLARTLPAVALAVRLEVVP